MTKCVIWIYFFLHVCHFCCDCEAAETECRSVSRFIEFFQQSEIVRNFHFCREKLIPKREICQAEMIRLVWSTETGNSQLKWGGGLIRKSLNINQSLINAIRNDRKHVLMILHICRASQLAVSAKKWKKWSLKKNHLGRIVFRKDFEKQEFQSFWRFAKSLIDSNDGFIAILKKKLVCPLNRFLLIFF